MEFAPGGIGEAGNPDGITIPGSTTVIPNIGDGAPTINKPSKASKLPTVVSTPTPTPTKTKGTKTPTQSGGDGAPGRAG